MEILNLVVLRCPEVIIKRNMEIGENISKYDAILDEMDMTFLAFHVGF